MTTIGLFIGYSSKVLVFTCEKFAGKDCPVIIVSLANNQMCRVNAFLEPSSESRIFDLYNEMVDNLTVKYGKPQNSYKFFKKPYYDGDGYEVQAVKKEKANFLASWELYKGDYKDCIWIKITNDVRVMLVYEDEILYNSFPKKKWVRK